MLGVPIARRAALRHCLAFLSARKWKQTLRKWGRSRHPPNDRLGATGQRAGALGVRGLLAAPCAGSKRRNARLCTLTNRRDRAWTCLAMAGRIRVPYPGPAGAGATVAGRYAGRVLNQHGGTEAVQAGEFVGEKANKSRFGGKYEA